MSLREATICAAIVAASVGGLTWWAGMIMAERSPEVYQLAPCVTEDSTEDCYFDATERGDGRGLSFVIIDGTLYLEDRSVTE